MYRIPYSEVPRLPIQYRPRREGRPGRPYPCDAEARGLVYRFGDFALDLDTRQLTVAGGEVHLSPKAFELLGILLANRQRAVAKTELQERLWPSTFVEETNLAGLVVEIRRALRDTASSPAFVRTIYGFGYRFVGDVKEEKEAEAGPPRSGLPLAAPRLIVDNRDVILTEGANIIGRASDATISIDARGVSRHHARVLLSDGEATLEDLGSKNGTHVNGSRVTTPVLLSDGDEIRMGAITVRFRMARPANVTETVGEWNQ